MSKRESKKEEVECDSNGFQRKRMYKFRVYPEENLTGSSRACLYPVLFEFPFSRNLWSTRSVTIITRVRQRGRIEYTYAAEKDENRRELARLNYRKTEVKLFFFKQFRLIFSVVLFSSKKTIFVRNYL